MQQNLIPILARNFALLTLLLAPLSGCSTLTPSRLPLTFTISALMSDQSIGAYSVSFLQQESISRQAEICAFIFQDITSSTVAPTLTPPDIGGSDGCRPRRPQIPSQNAAVFASFHTHGHYIGNALSEIPSTSDFQADRRQGIVGFVVTPGGRLWLVDPKADQIEMLCGLGCFPQDPNWRPGFGEPYPRFLTFQDLQQYEQRFREIVLLSQLAHQR